METVLFEFCSKEPFRVIGTRHLGLVICDSKSHWLVGAFENVMHSANLSSSRFDRTRMRTFQGKCDCPVKIEPVESAKEIEP